MRGAFSMDNAIKAVLDQYDRRAARERALMEKLTPEQIMQRVDEFLIPVGPDTGNLMNILVKGTLARNILELGTSYGYSTLFLAEAARATAGRVVSVDVSAEKQAYAREQIAAAGLESYVDFRTDDARQIIASLPGLFEFVLIDLWKDLYVPCFDLVYPKLSNRALLVADNILYPEFMRDEMLAYREHVGRQPGIHSVLLPVGNGIELSLYSA
jgi:predicted O-methyltransferase YrrM